MNKETLLNAIRNREKYLNKEFLDDDVDYLVTGEGPWFTNSQFGGHIYLDGDLTKYEIIGELKNGDRILFNSIDLHTYFTNNDDYDTDYIIFEKSGLTHKKAYQEIEKWFDQNQTENIVYYGTEYTDIKEHNDHANIEFIFYKENKHIHCATLGNVEHFITWNENNNDNFNNALALKR